MSVAMPGAHLCDPPERGRALGRRARRIGLVVFFASVSVNAALGIYALLAPHFGATQGKVLGTSFCITGAVLVALACEPAWERGLLGPLPYLGATLGVIAFGLAIAGMWAEPHSGAYGRGMGTVFVAAAACTAASLLSLARLSPRHRWVLAVTLAFLAVGATMLGVVFWLSDHPSTLYLRVMGIVLVSFAAFAVSVPVLHWTDRSALVADTALPVVAYCPHCGGGLAGELGVELRCRRCGRGFTVTPEST